MTEASTLRKVATFSNTGAKVAKRANSAKVYRDADMGEYVVKFYLEGLHLKRADYFTGDRADALGTACVQIGLPHDAMSEEAKRKAAKGQA